ALVLEHRLIAPTRAPGDGERVRSSEERVRLDERAEVLARLECRNAEEIRPLEVGPLALGAEARVEPWVRDAHPLRRHAQQLDGVPSGEVRVREEEVAGAR